LAPDIGIVHLACGRLQCGFDPCHPLYNPAKVLPGQENEVRNLPSPDDPLPKTVMAICRASKAGPNRAQVTAFVEDSGGFVDSALAGRWGLASFGLRLAALEIPAGPPKAPLLVRFPGSVGRLIMAMTIAQTGFSLHRRDLMARIAAFRGLA